MKPPSCFTLTIWAVYFASTSSAAAISSDSTIKRNHCHYLPHDPEWPRQQEWAQLNSSVGGRLIAGRPLAEVCHTPGFNSTECARLQDSWTFTQPHFDDPVSIMSPYWLNNSCSPFTPKTSSCTLGNIVSYTINVSSAADVAAGLKFAQEKNIRLAVKNTGHDFIGRSTGQGALGLWMHNLKDISFFDYNSTSYKGRAARMGAGVMAYEAYEAADANGVRIIGGFCSTVGLAGGYFQGAGHGPLASEYGLAADNTLELDVVTARGEHLTVSPTQHPDLFWALNGGGGGTYAVVLSQVTKAHQDGPVGGAALSYKIPRGTTEEQDVYWEAVSAWQTQLLVLNKNHGFQSVFTVTNATFDINFVTWPGHTDSEVATALKPFLDELEKRNITFTLSTSFEAGYYAHFAQYSPDLPYGTYHVSEVIGGRLIPHKAVERDVSKLTAAIRNITHDGRYTFNGISSNVSHPRVGNQPGSNAVLPAWRESLYSANMVAVWDPASPLAELVAFQHEVTNDLTPQLDVLTPGSGAYMSEATFDIPNWKTDFFGTNYDRLLSIKKKYDPNSVFYGPAVVGSDYWDVAGDGRLCRAK